MRHQSLKLLEAGSLILFGLLALAARSQQFSLSVVGVRLCVDSGLFVIVGGSVLIGRPFTLQYAREQVSPEIAATNTFETTNLKLSAIWALAFAAIVATDTAMLYLPSFTPVIGTAVIVAVLAGATFVTAWLPKRVGRRS